jgi:predicted phosphoribosyltransferase
MWSVCLERFHIFGAIGAYYDNFRQITDEELIAVLARFPPQGGDAGSGAASRHPTR